MNPGVLAAVTLGLGYLFFKARRVPECLPKIRVWKSSDHPIDIPPTICNNPDYNRVFFKRPDGNAIKGPRSGGIIEGPKFEPLSLREFDYMAAEAPSLKEVLAIPGNSVYGYVDYLMEVGGITDATEITDTIMRETMVMTVGSTEDEDEGVLTLFQRWAADLGERLSPYIIENGGIPFDLPADWDKE